MEHTQELFAPPKPVDWKERKATISKIRNLLRSDSLPSVQIPKVNDCIFQNQFPSDILGYIFSFLSFVDLNHSLFVCHSWKNIIFNTQAIWKRLFLRRWHSKFSYTASSVDIVEQVQLVELAQTPIDWRYEFTNRYMWETYYYPFYCE